MRDLVEEIDSHAKVIDLDISSNPAAAEGQVLPSPLSNPNPQMAMNVTPNSSKQT